MKNPGPGPVVQRYYESGLRNVHFPAEDAQATSRLPAAALRLGGILHPPVVLRRELWPELMALEGDVGCRRLIRGRPELVAAVEVPGPGGHPVDIDTPEDYRRLLDDAGGGAGP